VRKHRSWPTGENRRDPPRALADPAVADGENAAMKREQITAVDPSSDEARREPQRDQLTTSDDAVLSLGHPSNQLSRVGVPASPAATTTSTCIAFATYFLANAMRMPEGQRRHAGRRGLGAGS
jgi:hypothetical protein